MRRGNALQVLNSIIFSKNFPLNGKINVLHISLSPIAGAPLRISNLLSDKSAKYNSIIATEKFYYNDGREFDFDVFFNQKRWMFRLKKLVGSADIVHFHNESYFKLFDSLQPEIQGKTVLIQWHSGIDEMSTKLGLTPYDLSSSIKVKQIVIAQAQRNDYPSASVVPNIPHLRGHRPEFKKMTYGDPVRLVYTPTSITSRFRCGQKGQALIMDSLSRVKALMSDRVDIVIVQGKNLKQCLNIKAASHIGLDDISSGGYHLSTLENLYSGLVNVNNISQSTIKTLKEIGRADLADQVIGCPENSLTDVLTEMVQDRDRIEIIRKRSYEWMRENWNEEWCLSRYEAIYNSL